MGLSVSVNLSAQDLQDKVLPEKIARMCDQSGCPTDLVKFELTETAIFRDSENAFQIIHRLETMGCLVSIDDFGTGYSSLSRLKRLPLNEIKIDRSFVSGITDDPNDLAIVKATINMGHDLGIDVVAEGVENQQVLGCLADLNYDRVQGFLVSPPLPAAELDKWLRQSLKQGGRLGL